jgi:hypothetical protein
MLLTDDKRKWARNLTTPTEVLAELASDRDWFVRYLVASNPNASVDTLGKLRRDNDPDVRYHAAVKPQYRSLTYRNLNQA